MILIYSIYSKKKENMAKRLTKEELLLRTPPGLTDALSDFTTAVLRSQPDNIIKFAKEYFNRKYAETYDDSG